MTSFHIAAVLIVLIITVGMGWEEWCSTRRRPDEDEDED
jgi:hypothetical protein